MRGLGWTIILALGTGCSGCSPSTPAGPSDASSDVDGGSSDAKDEPTPCTPKPRPSFVPAGWRPLDEYRPCSGLYVPTKVEELPAPPVWESCGADVDPPIAGCERIALDPGSKGYYGSTDASLDGNGNVYVLVSRDLADRQTMLVADTNGKVYSAVMATDLKSYQISQALLQSINAPGWLVAVYDTLRKKTEGVLVGSTKAIGPSAARIGSGGSISAVIGPPGIVFMENNANLQLLDFNDPSKKLLDITTSAQNNNIPNSFAMWHGSSLFWFGNSGRTAIQRRWDVDTGPVDFINYNDPDHGAGDLGTDGKDMVWVESHGPKTANAFWSTADYWTSPYVKDKKDLKPRRLRSEIPNVLAGDHVKVGCGRAALYTGGGGLRIVNIADGSSWFIADSKKTGWGWIEPLVLTCDHLYSRVGYSGPSVTIGKLPFANLGPADPPD